jgi:metallo-beta-lactamase family protein
MDIKLRFLGAAENVTGSCHLLEANGVRVLVDCGFYQERDFKHRNWEPFAEDPATIDAVVLTHAHLDHCGLLPKLARDGFKGTVFATEASADIAEIVMRDSAKIQAEARSPMSRYTAWRMWIACCRSFRRSGTARSRRLAPGCR